MSEVKRLQYNYASIMVDTGLCVGCGTYSYEINDPAFVLVPSASSAYIGKYYHDGSWYEDAEFTIPWSIGD